MNSRNWIMLGVDFLFLGWDFGWAWCFRFEGSECVFKFCYGYWREVEGQSIQCSIVMSPDMFKVKVGPQQPGYIQLSWKSDIAATCWCREWLSDDSIGELSWSVGRHQVGAAFNAIPSKR